MIRLRDATKGEGHGKSTLKATEAKVNLPVENGKIFDRLECWQLVKEADVIISVPKLKTHDQTEMTCAIKKLKGLLTDKAKKAMHQEGLFDGVIDLLNGASRLLRCMEQL
jgi:uncharacterized protein (DUF362 family)